MKAAMRILIQALVIACIWGAVGIGSNLFANTPIPWIYEPPKTLDIEGVKVQLVDEKQAKDMWSGPDTVFVDARNQQDYAKSHVKGSVFLSPDDVRERFVSVEPFLPQDSRIVLYCYGPECDMAERVAGFLVQMGYRNLAIMSAGFVGWQRAGHPVEAAPDSSESPDRPEQGDESEVC